MHLYNKRSALWMAAVGDSMISPLVLACEGHNDLVDPTAAAKMAF